MPEDEDYNEYDDEIDRVEKDVEPHFKCYEYKDLKAQFDQCIENGVKSICPNCGFGGIKDDGCTHMTC